MAIACLRLVTFLPLRPLLRVPRLRLRIADSTSFDALLDVLRREDERAVDVLLFAGDFREEDLREVDLRGAMIVAP